MADECIDLNGLADITPPKIALTSDTVTTIVEAGQTIKLETSPDGAEIASGTVPEGKQWTIQWILAISETAAQS